MILNNFFEPRKKSIAEDLDKPTQLAPGLSATTSSKTGLTTQKYSMGPANFNQTFDAKGKVLSRDLEIDHGTGKFATGQAGGVTSKAYTPAPGQEGMSSRDLYSMGNANKAATYDRAAAAVNEAPMSPASPALAAPKAPSAPAAPAIPAAFSATTNGQYNQVRDKSRVNGVWRNNPQAASPMSQDPAQRITGYQAAEKQASEPGTIPGADDFDSWEQNGDTAVPVSKGGVRQNLYKMPVGQVPQGANITQKYNTYQQQGAHAFPVEPQGGIDQLSKIPLSQVPKGANIVQAPTPAGNLYKNLPGTLEEEDRSVDPELINQIYQTNQDVIGNNPNLIKPGQVLSLPNDTSYTVQRGDTLYKIAGKVQTPVAAPVDRSDTPTLYRDPASGTTIRKDPNPVAYPLPVDKQPATPTGSSVFDVFPDIGGKIYDLTHPSTIINNPPVAGHQAGTVVRPDWSQTKYKDLGTLTKGPDGRWRDKNGLTAVDPALIAMAEKLPPVQGAKAPPAPVIAPPPPVPATKASPEMVPAADSMGPGEEIVTAKKSKTPVVQPKSNQVPAPKTGIAAAADKAGDVVTKTVQGAEKLEKGAEKAIKKGAEWFGDLVGNNAETPGSKDPYSQVNNRGSSAYGRYQFMPSTFDGLVKLSKPGDPLYGKTFKDFQDDPAVQDATMRAADLYYTNVLARGKVPATVGNKYLAHFVGAENAVGMINDMPETTPLTDLYPDRKLKDGTTVPNKFFTQNNFRTNMTVGDLRDWADTVIVRKPKKIAKESAVANTIQTVKVMLETASTQDDIRHIRNYIDRQYIRHDMVDEVAFAQRNHLVERVIEITNQRRLLAR